jgi:dienelactone hydrolase
VVAHAWYPAERSAAPPAPYVDRIEDTDLFRRSYGFVGFDRIRRVRTHAVDGARLADAHRRYPVILFSHGLGSVSALYSTFHENLASHGYVVVGVDHPYFSAAMRLPDGRVVMNESRRPWPGPGATAEQQAELVRIRDEEAVVQAQDLRFVLDRLEALNVKHPDGRFAGRLDLDHVGAFGHSRGGFAAPHACYLDGRFDACLNLDGYPLTNAVMAQGIRQPYMHIEETSGPEPTDEELLADHTTREQYRREVEQELREQQATFSRMKSGMYHVLVTGARHTSFTDGPFIAPDTARNVRINAGRALEITNAYLLAFFDRTLRGRRTRLLDGVSPQFPEVRLEVNRPGRPREVFQGKEAE